MGATFWLSLETPGEGLEEPIVEQDWISFAGKANDDKYLCSCASAEQQNFDSSQTGCGGNEGLTINHFLLDDVPLAIHVQMLFSTVDLLLEKGSLGTQKINYEEVVKDVDERIVSTTDAKKEMSKERKTSDGKRRPRLWMCDRQRQPFGYPRLKFRSFTLPPMVRSDQPHHI